MRCEIRYFLLISCIIAFGIVIPLPAQQKSKLNYPENPDSLKKMVVQFFASHQLKADTFEHDFVNFLNKSYNEDSTVFLFSLGYAHFIQKNYVSAIKYSLQARNLVQQIKNKPIEAEILLQIGYSYQRLSYYEKALYYYYQALQCENNALPPTRKNRTLIDIGNAFFSQNENDSSLFYYKLAYENATQTKDSQNIISCLVNLGNLYMTQKNDDESEKSTNKALELCLLRKSDSKIMCYFNLGQLYYNKHHYLISKEYFEKVLSTIKESQYESLWPEVYKFRAIMDYETGNYEFAIQNCRLFHATMHKYYSNEIFLKSLHAINEILANLTNRQDVNELLKINIKVSDSIFNAEITAKKGLEESFQQLLRLEKNNKTLEQENRINKEKLKLSKVAIISTLIILLLISLGLIVILGIKNRIRNQNKIILSQLQDITTKNKEANDLNQKIIAQTGKISQQNELLTEYQEHLENLIEERTNALSKALLRAQESDKLKTSFLQNISHEIRTPLNAISGFSQLLRDEIDNKEEYIDIINENIFDLIEMVENIMIFSKIHSNQLVVQKSEFNTTDLIHEIENTIEEIRAKYKNREITFSINNKINNHFKAFSDYSLIKKIAIQLIENAFKYTEKGKIEAVFNHHDTMLLFAVSDTGIGIKKDQIPNIFDTFRKIEGEHKLFRGTGIGLAIVKKLIQMLEGEIHVDSEFGFGTTLTIKIPCN